MDIVDTLRHREKLVARELDTEGRRERLIEHLLSQLETSYQIKVVSRPNEKSGVWRIPDVNTNALNYVIVEAIDNNGKVLPMVITNEESGKVNRSELASNCRRKAKNSAAMKTKMQR